MNPNIAIGATIVCAVVAISVVTALITTLERYTEENRELRRSLKKQHERDSDFQWLGNQTTSASPWQKHVGTESSWLLFERLSMDFEAMDACKAMLREAAKHQNSYLE